VTLAARLLNHGAGHALPTSKNESGELWLELSATTADGTVLYKDSLAYSVVYNDVEGKHDSPLSLWDAASLFNDRRLMPGLASEEQFAFVVPIDVRGDVKVDVALMYRDVPAWLSEQLSLPQADASVVRRTAVILQVLEPLPVPTYVAATPAPTPMPIATDSVGTTSGVKMDDWGWVAPFVGGGAILLMGLAAWALRRRAV